MNFVEKIAGYISKYAPKYNICVHSPIIAQAILESASGTSELAANANNFFGLKWRENRCPTSNGFYIKVGSEQNADGSYTSSAMKWFRFPDMEACVQGYFDFINNANYSILKGVTDPREYLENIKSAGYATSLKYVENLMNVIQKYDLTKYDDIEGERMYKVCIDSGHYGKYNRSPGNKNYYESEVMWKLHLMQKKYLEQLGIEVITTRSDLNTDLALHSRGMTSKGCDLFISNHSNAVGSAMNENVDYVALYHLTDDTTTKVDDISKEIAHKLAPVIADTMGVKCGYKVLTREASYDRNKDGILNDNYYGVLHGARIANSPGVLIEHSFHTNSNAVNWLLNNENLERLAKVEAECIAAYLKGNTTTNTSGNVDTTPKAPETASKPPYLVKVNVSSLNVRSGAGLQYKVKTVIKKNEVYTIVEEKDGWGKLKSGAGWIRLNYTKRM